MARRVRGWRTDADPTPLSGLEVAVGEQVCHIPVMVHKVLDLLITDREGTYVDCTLGSAGHARALLEALSPSGMLIGLDADSAALEVARAQLREFKGRYRIFHASFADLANVLDLAGVGIVDGVLFDLGLSSMQLADKSRGFAHSEDGPLDMRFDASKGIPAAELVNSAPRRRLTEIFRELGQVRRPGAFSGAIERARSSHPIETTHQLVDAVEHVLRRGPGRRRQLGQLFQSLRIAVNSELDALDQGLDAAAASLKAEGVLAAISYHSLEDRKVKRFMRERKSSWTVLTRKPLTPSPEEVASNPRARSAKLRAAAKTGANAIPSGSEAR